MDKHDGDLYFEEVNAYVDAIVEVIKAGEAVTKEYALLLLEERVEESSYCRDDGLGAVVLLYSDYPTAYFAELGWNNKAEKIAPNGTSPFPFARFAAAAMTRDAATELQARPEFAALLNGDEGLDDEEDEEDDEENEEV